MNFFKCDVCGRFISYADLKNGRACHIMILPDSEYSIETWETLCSKHNQSFKRTSRLIPLYNY